MTADALDIDTLKGWIGRSEDAQDILTPELVKRFGATIPDLGNGKPQETRISNGHWPGIHWCLAPQAVPMADIGADGHPQRGGFLPPVPLPRRMWAGGEVAFVVPLKIGVPLRRKSTIENVMWRKGRTGPLCFVTLRHDIYNETELALHEWQNIVYRGKTSKPGGIEPDDADAPADAQWQCVVAADPLLLFRYSALTFNSHRIHYDRGYSTQQEGYPGLVVHGPLQATLLLHFAMRIKGKPPRTFSFRSTKPIFDGGEFHLNAREKDAALNLWTTDQMGRSAMSAQARW